MGDELTTIQTHKLKEILYMELLNVPPDEILSYEVMTNLIGKCVQRKARHALVAAIEKLRCNDGIIFETIRGVGVKRLRSAGVIDSLRGSMERVRRINAVAAQKAATVDVEDLTREEQHQFCAQLVILAETERVTNAKAVDAARQRAVETDGRIEASEFLQLMRAMGKPKESPKQDAPQRD